MQGSVQAFAPAKINLALHITARRPDGYHTIDSIVAFAEVGDILRVSLAGSLVERTRIVGTGPYAGMLPPAAENLVYMAAEHLARAGSSKTVPPLSVEIDKRLPVASGLGGGSADAAAMLRAAEFLWGFGGTVDLQRIARRIGADVAMCLHSKMARVRGIGDEIEKFPDPPVIHAVLANPGIALHTGAVFRRLIRRDNPPIPGSGCEVMQIDRIAGMRNDLEPAAIALVPEIAELLELIRCQPGCLFARMSGSGASCFGIFSNGEQAARAQIAVRDALPTKAWCVATRLGSPKIELQKA